MCDGDFSELEPRNINIEDHCLAYLYLPAFDNVPILVADAVGACLVEETTEEHIFGDGIGLVEEEEEALGIELGDGFSREIKAGVVGSSVIIEQRFGSIDDVIVFICLAHAHLFRCYKQ